MNERFNNKSEKPKDYKKEKVGMPRREFLKRASNIAALGFLPFGAGFLAETPHAWSKEIKEGDPWIVGLKALKDEVFHSHVESMALLVKRKKGEAGWKRFARGKFDGLSVPVEIIEEEVFGDNEEVKLAHTHPLDAFTEHGLAPFAMEEIQGGKRPAPAMPPSIDDIIATISFHSELSIAQNKKNFSELVLDPSGVWEYTPDLTHDFPKTFLAYLAKRRARLTILTEDKDILNILNKKETIADANTFLRHLRSVEWGHLSPPMQKLIQEIESDERALIKMLGPLYETAGLYIKQSLVAKKLDVDSLSAMYKNFGINLSFSLYKDIGVE
ncbi:MAG: hypothetical protein HYT93_02490 [Parcubacteria group bacterium]|nr:hypothetical protein [Parcubacteria group bacterium]